LPANHQGRASCPLIIKDGHLAHPTKLGNLFFGVPLSKLFSLLAIDSWLYAPATDKSTEKISD
jgi:hypothetical protein